MFQAMAGHDPKDSTSNNSPPFGTSGTIKD